MRPPLRSQFGMNREFVRVVALGTAAEKWNLPGVMTRVMQQAFFRAARVEDHRLVRAENGEGNSAHNAVAVVVPLDFFWRERVITLMPGVKNAAAKVAVDAGSGRLERELSGGAHRAALPTSVCGSPVARNLSIASAMSFAVSVAAFPN